MIATAASPSVCTHSRVSTFATGGKPVRAKAAVGKPSKGTSLSKGRVQASVGHQGENKAKDATRTGTLFTAATATMLASLPQPVFAAIDSVFSRDFNVSFMGMTVDHKIIIELIVLGQFVGFIGATVSGIEARKRKAEVEFLNNKLLEVNKELRKELREGKAGQYRSPKVTAIQKEGLTEEQNMARECVVTLMRNGKQLLKQKDAKESRHCFEQSLTAIENAGSALESPWKAYRKTYRGLGAAYQLEGRNKDALGCMQKVLKLCEEHNDQECKGDTLGVIADIYTDLGEIELAAKFYDEYIQMLYSLENAEA
uniref:Protein FLUORESCENT IN BLUE LIGHT, chloroplastic n=2 Tax=Pyramimonas obovata TaxID=1411642 RepID=A0A7S0RSJ9_9CHLO|eukprot:CAMPEP_0118934780 /NCGR_PEP_ID=MMETSP1169-20130426/14145_1 /TAXON_ID=36882 /ORGANISM="Pyramimonas obovata, Strain CCMP722" /LENGTH=311 /DNA_ID=CAMNT_0006877717 /DNA_START=54 /DNA_END=989 /DNA_ORIENTATION=+